MPIITVIITIQKKLSQIISCKPIVNTGTIIISKLLYQTITFMTDLFLLRSFKV